VQYFSYLYHDFFSLNLAQQNVGCADTNLQGAGETRFAYQLYVLAGTETHRKQALVQGLIGVDRDDSGDFAGIHAG
jgi:hypothetical protein